MNGAGLRRENAEDDAALSEAMAILRELEPEQIIASVGAASQVSANQLADELKREIAGLGATGDANAQAIIAAVASVKDDTSAMRPMVEEIYRRPTAAVTNIAGDQFNAGRDLYNTTITLTSGKLVERLFMAPSLPPYAIVGRNALLADLRAFVLAGNNVALATHGKGGVGKTALATMLAWDDGVLEHFSGGVLWAALGPNGDPDAALGTLISALLGPEVPLATLITTARIATVKAAPAMRRFLIALDGGVRTQNYDLCYRP